MTGTRRNGSTSTSASAVQPPRARRSEEHTSELQSQSNLVCRLLLEKKKTTIHIIGNPFTFNSVFGLIPHNFNYSFSSSLLLPHPRSVYDDVADHSHVHVLTSYSLS